MSEFSASFAAAKQRALNAAVNVKNPETAAAQKAEVKDFKKAVKPVSNTIGRSMIAEARALAERRRKELTPEKPVKPAVKAVDIDALMGNISQYVQKNITEIPSKPADGKRLERRNTAESAIVPADKEILRRFLSNGMTYMRACPLEEAAFAQTDADKVVFQHLRKNVKEIGMSALKELMALYFVYPALKPADRSLVRAVFGYLFSSDALIPHNTPDTGFADDRVVIHYVHEKFKSRLVPDCFPKNLILRQQNLILIYLKSRLKLTGTNQSEN